MAGHRTRGSAILCALALLAGCGKGNPENVGRVSGHVTLDGQPLPGALVTFAPVQPGGSSSLGRTDDAGQYTLGYAGQIEGAEVGQHRVTITTYSRGNADADPPRPQVPEKVPAKYNHQSELTADVKAGDNAIDFPLASDGPIAPSPLSGEGCN